MNTSCPFAGTRSSSSNSAAEPSPVREVFVKFGDIVKPGQLLAILDSTFSEADLRKAEQDMIGVQAKIARLQAERSRSKDFPIEEDATVEWIREQALFEARNAARTANIAEIDQEIEKTDASVAKNETMIDLNGQRQEMLQGEVDRYTRLVDKGAEPASILMTRKDDLLEAVIRGREYELQLTSCQ